jgi:hypothetical protein
MGLDFIGIENARLKAGVFGYQVTDAGYVTGSRKL